MRFFLLLLALYTAAENIEPRPMSPETALLRVWVSESGFRSPADQLGIWRVLTRRARSTEPARVVDMIRRYSGRALPPHESPYRSPHRSKRQRWVNELDCGCERPPSLEIADAWWRESYRPRCLAMCSRARALFAGRDPFAALGCDVGTTPSHWGGAMDDPRAIMRWRPVLVTCGDVESKNHFWCDPKHADCYGVPVCDSGVEP